jgi:ketosteroid isomerase-like protein
MRILTGGDIAFVHALEQFTGKLTNGQQSDMWIRYTGGLHKINGKWLLVHDHVSVPTDFRKWQGSAGSQALDRLCQLLVSPLTVK